MSQVLGNPNKTYHSFKDQLEDDKGFKEMVFEYYKAGGRKKAEIEYELNRFISQIVNNPDHETQYQESALRLLKLNAEFYALFSDEFGRCKK